MRRGGEPGNGGLAPSGFLVQRTYRPPQEGPGKSVVPRDRTIAIRDKTKVEKPGRSARSRPERPYEPPHVPATDTYHSPFEATGDRDVQIIGGEQVETGRFLGSLVRAWLANNEDTLVVDLKRPSVSDRIVWRADKEGFSHVEDDISATRTFAAFQEAADDYLFAELTPDARKSANQLDRERVLDVDAAARKRQFKASAEAAEVFATTMPDAASHASANPDDQTSDARVIVAHMFYTLGEVSLPKLYDAASELLGPEDAQKRRAREGRVMDELQAGRQQSEHIMTPAQRARITEHFGTGGTLDMQRQQLQAIKNHALDLILSDNNDAPTETQGSRQDGGLLWTQRISSDDRQEVTNRARLLVANLEKLLTDPKSKRVPKNLVIIGVEDINPQTLQQIKASCESRKTRLVEVVRDVPNDQAGMPKVRDRRQTVVILGAQGIQATVVGQAVGEVFAPIDLDEKPFNLATESGRLPEGQCIVVTSAGEVRYAPLREIPGAVDYEGTAQDQRLRDKRKGRKLPLPGAGRGVRSADELPPLLDLPVLGPAPTGQNGQEALPAGTDRPAIGSGEEQPQGQDGEHVLVTRPARPVEHDGRPIIIAARDATRRSDGAPGLPPGADQDNPNGSGH